MSAALPEATPTVCGSCGLYYIYPAYMDYAQNPCPQCGRHNHNGHG